MTEHRKRVRPATPGIRADQTDIDDAVAKSDIGASGSYPPSPNELVPSATGVGPRGGSSSVSRGGEAIVPAGGSALATPTFLAAVAAVALGLVVLLGWATGIQRLTTILPDAVPMKANAALLLVLSGAALAVRASGRRPRMVGALAIVVLVVASATALEYSTGIDLGIDRLLASDVARPGAPYPGRMALSAVIGFGACALGLLSLEHTWRGWHPSAFLALIDAVIGGLGVLGYAYSASQLTSIGSVTQIAFPAAIGLVLLAGALIATDPEHGFMRLLRDPGLAGGLTRRLVPTALLILPFFGWLELGSIDAGLFDDHIGVAVLVLFEALILGAVGVWTAGGFLQTERTRETERKGAEQALHDSAILLNETQELAKIGGWAYDAATKTVLWSDEVYRIHEVSSRDYNPSSAVRDVAFYAPEDQATIDEAFRGAVDEGRPYDLELRLITATGREIWVRTAARPQFQDGRVVRVHGHIQDITERKMAEEELRAANERVRRLFDANLFGSLIVRENGAILEANDYYLDLIGHTRDELERGELDWRAITPAEWLPVSDDAIGRTIAGGASLPYEKEYLRADGTRVPVLVAVTHLSGPDEVIAAFVLDITERKQAMEELRAAYDRLQRFVDSSVVGICVSRANGEIVEANDYYLDLVGYTREELERGEIDWRTLTPAEWLPADERGIAEVGERGVCSPYEKEYVGRDGRRVPVIIAYTALPGPSEDLAVFALDISDRKQAEARLAERNALLTNIIESTEAAVFAIDREYRYTSFNRQHADVMKALYGVDIELGGSVLDYQSSTQDYVQSKKNLDRALAGERFTDAAFNGEDELNRAYFEVTQGPVRDEAGRIVGASVFARDTTERHRVEEGIRALNTELEQRVVERTGALEAANRELEAFSYSVSHDLRAPLRSIDGFSRILLDEHSATLDVEGERVLGVVIRNVKQMGLLIDDLLAFSRVTRATLERRPVDMQRLAQGVVEELQAAYPDREVSFDVGPLAEVPGDQALLRQVWLNLLGNAVKFTRPVEHAAVEVRSERRGGECRYTVRDNGVGFDPAYTDKLFAPFQRLHTASEFEGTGVGLAIVARIVQRHGGRVWAEAAPGSGALFGFSLPDKLEAT